MRLGAARLVVCLALGTGAGFGFSGSARVGRQAAPSGIDDLSVVGGAPLTITVASGRSDGVTEFDLRYVPSSGAPSTIQDVMLTAVVPGATATVIPPPNPGFTLSAGASVQLFLQVSGVAGDRNELPGELYAQVGGQTRTVAKIAVLREFGVDAVTVLDASGGSIALPADGETFLSAVTLSSVAPIEIAVQVGVSALRSPTGVAAPAFVWPAEGPVPALAQRTDSTIVPVSAGQTADVDLSATLPEVGTYTGFLTLSVGGLRASPLKLNITRAGGEVEATLTPDAPGHGSFGVSSGSAWTGVLVTNSSGAPQDYTFSLASIHRENEEGAGRQATSLVVACPMFGTGPAAGTTTSSPSTSTAVTSVLTTATASATTATTATTTATTTPTTTGTTATTGTATTGTTTTTTAVRAVGTSVCTFPANQTGEVRVRLGELWGAGRYTATILVERPGRAAKTVDVVVVLRRNWWQAAGFLLLGLLITLVLQGVARARGRLARLKRVAYDATLVDQAALPAADAYYADVAVRLGAQITEIRTAVDDAATGVDVLIDSLDRKVALTGEWSRLAEQADTAGVAKPPELDTVRGLLMSGDPLSADAYVAAGQTLVTAEQKIIGETTVRPMIDRLAAAVTRWESETQPPAELVTALRDKLKAASDSVVAGAVGMAQTAVTEAYAAWLGALAHTLRVATEARPRWVAPEVWAAVEQAAQAAADDLQTPAPGFDPEGTRARFEQALGAVLASSAAALAEQARQAGAAADATDRPKYAAVATAADGAVLALRAGSLSVGRASLEQATERWQAAAPRQAQMEGLEITNAVPEMLPATARLGRPSASRSRIPNLPARSTLRTWTLFLAVVVNVITIGIALVIGLATQYLPNPTWGMSGDILSGILWGAGLGSAQFAGLAALRKTLTTPPQ